MAKKNHTLGKFLALTTTVAAIGGTCYVFRDQIKESSIYKKSSDKISKLFQKISDKVCTKAEDDIFFDEEDELYSDSMFSEDAKQSREYTSITINSKEAGKTEENPNTEETSVTVEDTKEEVTSEVTEDTKEEVTSEAIEDTKKEDTSEVIEDTKKEEAKEEDMKEIFSEESIPTISIGSDFSSLSTFEDPDVLEEQDKLDF